VKYNLKFIENEKRGKAKLETSVKLYKNLVWIGKAAVEQLRLNLGRNPVKIGFDYDQKIVAIIPDPEGTFSISINEKKPIEGKIYSTAIINPIAATVGTRPDVSIDAGMLILQKG